jgi:demethylmenaquinone methyltransferase/2-methoxy-6-polyprenyl-1,4-benzoquinol methylase
LPSDQFDVIICVFGLKTFVHGQLRQLAKETQELLKLGGYFSFIKVSQPDVKVLRFLCAFYMGKLVPILGRLLLGNPIEHRMLWKYKSRGSIREVEG